MLPPGTDPKRLAAFITLAQVGLEMVVPVILGLVVDQGVGTTPWLTILGAMLGLSAGVLHLVVLSSQSNDPPRDGEPR